ncbi:MAG: geranylgeranylglycerol-phosphate geranylgeranyltransferase [Anaerolineae bacterium]|uniref:geranylgeranylglycerol-phosphate geranylgeranyltransferase n=1 Tax=Promineifilum sp. TaxID=2664178 RepID=UPI001E06E1B4|nr:geranylgeranylglycerol-phosphate geranylgeranyltransferase [Anaerolineales bacterium]MCB8935457.1 geranylgeranylglycerol-phosphate geranylgeranyltransferase [Promineifilum sp.]MCO5180510.1 geranylgeranylglycerol-phosphate geranylgeranyltransferase [Promineifilum sp.]MCW5847733.1 geranylgeranylglycerol-phosphate geranylgeranyltransferase [Anaerolineae bacterium]
MTKTFKGLYKISRPLSTLTGVLAVILGGYVAGTGAWDKIALAALATLLVSAAANAWNDYRDIDIDRINQPQRPLPSGMVSPRAVLIFSVVLAVLSVILAALISPTALLIAVASNVLLYIYSVWLKSTVLLGNATVALISAMSPVFGGVAAGNVRPSLWLGAIIFVGILGREVLKTLADYDGDQAHHVRTISTAIGPRAARTIFFFLLGATAIIMLAPYLVGHYHAVYAWIVALGVFPVAIYVIIRVTRERTGPQLERLSQLLKYDFLIWFIAVLLGAAV